MTFQRRDENFVEILISKVDQKLNKNSEKDHLNIFLYGQLLRQPGRIQTSRYLQMFLFFEKVCIEINKK